MLSLLKKKSRKAVVLAKEFTAEELATVRREESPGWAKLPRHIMPFLSLLREKRLVGGNHCDLVYLELLTRDYGHGVIETMDAKDHAYLVGFTGQRAARSWDERIQALVELGVIVAKPRHERRFGYLLLRDPDFAVLHIERRPEVRSETHLLKLISCYWRERELHGGADADKVDLAQGAFVGKLRQSVRGAGMASAGGAFAGKAAEAASEAVAARLLVIEAMAELPRLLDEASDDSLLECAAGLETKAIDDVLKIGGAAERWATIKKTHEVGARVAAPKRSGGVQ